MKVQSKGQASDLKNMELKVDMKLTQMREDHEKEVDRINKNHQEQMNSLTQKLSYYKKQS